MKQKLIWTCGLPASGKSTWAKEQAKLNPSIVIINRDSIRQMLKGEYKVFPHRSSMEDLVTTIEKASIFGALNKGYDVIVDSTGFRYSVNSWKATLSDMDIDISCKDFTEISLETCIKRDKSRENSVGEVVVMSFYNKYLKDKI